MSSDVSNIHLGQYAFVFFNQLQSFYFSVHIADYYSLEDRTSGMSDFVSASAAGMALGPAIAASLSIVAPTELSDSNSYWTIETAPGEFLVFAFVVECII